MSEKNIAIEKEIHKKIKILASKKDKRIKDLTNQFLKEKLEEEGDSIEP